MDGIFLHTGWRSSGTWLWSKLRAEPGNMGFYEPLHEALPALNPRRIRRLQSSGWPSRHSELANPYFEEYRPLLRRGWLRPARGVAGADPAFSFDRFFMGAHERHDALASYIGRLCRAAREAGRCPVLKFTRSQGRAAWFAAQFPGIQHAVVIRQPWAQFRSGWRCMAEGNPYFLAVPLLLLERNIAVPEVAAMVSALGLPVQPVAAPPVLRMKHWVKVAPALPAETLYRAHFALWLLNAERALPAADVVLDGDAEPAKMLAPLGLHTALAQRPFASLAAEAPPLRLAALRACHAIAGAAIRPGAALSGQIGHWVALAEAEAARDLGAPALPGRVLRPAQPVPA